MAGSGAETDAVATYLASIENAGRRADALVLDQLFRDVTGWKPRLYGTIVGYGTYDYTYETGHSGRCQATGFAPRSGNMVVYIMPGYTDFPDILAQLGPHKKGKACLYLGRLTRVDLDVLGELIRAGVEDLRTRRPVRAT